MITPQPSSLAAPQPNFQNSSPNIRDNATTPQQEFQTPNSHQNTTTTHPNSPYIHATPTISQPAAYQSNPSIRVPSPSAVSSNIFLPLAINSPSIGRHTENCELIGFQEELSPRPFEILEDQMSPFQGMGFSFQGMGYDEWYGFYNQ